MTDDISFQKNSDEQVAVPCQIKISDKCVQSGDFFENEEDAREWVEDECWVFSGEGYICPECNLQIFINIAKIRVERGR